MPKRRISLPSDLIDPSCPSRKRIRAECTGQVFHYRCLIPPAFQKIRQLRYALAKSTEHHEIIRVQQELNRNINIIASAREKMKKAYRERGVQLRQVRTPAIFRFLSKKDRNAARIAQFLGVYLISREYA